MNRKQLILLLVVLVVIGGACLVLLNRNQESWSASGDKLGRKVMPNFQVNDVAAIHLQGDTALDLEKKDDRWRVRQRNDYPANFSQISELLIKMGDLKIAQAEAIGPSQLGRMHLEEPGKGPDSGTLVDFKDAQGKVLQSLLIGKKHTRKSSRPSPIPGMDDEFPDGRYVMLKSDPGEVLTVSDPLSVVDPKPAEWLDKDFFKVEKPKSISFTSTNAAESWTLTRTNENGAWVLSGAKAGEALDTNKVASFSSTLASPSFVDVESDPAAIKIAMAKPLLLNIQTFDGFDYLIKIGSKNGENEYSFQVNVTGDFPTTRPKTKESPEAAKSLDQLFAGKLKQVQGKLKDEEALKQWTYLVNNWLVDPMIRSRAQLMVEKKTDKKESAAPSKDGVGQTPTEAPEAPGVSFPTAEPGPTDK